MTYKLIPRFNYALPFPYYFKLWKKKNTANIFNKPGNDLRVYHFNQARVGLRVLLNSISKKKLNVGVQAYTCHTVFQAIHNSGNNIVFLDLTDEFKLDFDDLSKKIAEIDVLIITHTFGFPDNMDEIKKIAKNKIIIEDCSHSFLSKYKGQFTGKIGDAAIFSTGLAKFPPIGAGGFCLVNNFKIFPAFKTEYSKIPIPSKLESIKVFCKAVLSSIVLKPPFFGLFSYDLIKKLDQKLDVGNKFTFTETKGYKWVRVIFDKTLNFFYKESNKQGKNFKFLALKIPANCSNKQISEVHTPNYYIFPLLSKKRDELYNKLLENNIQAGKHFHNCLDWANDIGQNTGRCPNTEKITEQIITLPIHPEVNTKNIIKISDIINSIK